MDMSNSDEINSSENQQLPTFKDPKGCLDITTNHQNDDDTKKIVILHQDPKGCQDITMGGDKKDDDTKKTMFLYQNPKGCQDITMDEQIDDDANKIEILHQNPKGCQDNITMGIKERVVLQEDPKGCQDIIMDHQKCDDTNNIVMLHQVPNGCQGDIAQDHHHEDGGVDETIVLKPIEDKLVPEDGVVNEIIALQPIVENGVVPEDDDDGFRTPTSLESKIPILTTCPPAPKYNYSGIKRKASSPPRRGERNKRVWIDYRRRDIARF